MASFEEQAVSYIRERVTVNDKGCWIPRNKPRQNGYVRVSFNGYSWYMHRLSHCAFIGPVDAGNDVCHKCDVRNCCNPDHLFQGSREVNMRDAVAKGRQAKGFQLPQAKLSTKDKDCIIYLVNKGCEYPDIAKLFNVTRHTIGRVALSNGITKRAA